MCAGVSAHAHKNWGQQYEGHAIFVRSVSLALMVLSIFMAVYAAYNFHRRGEMLQCALHSYEGSFWHVAHKSATMLAETSCSGPWVACRAKMDGPYDSRLLPVLLAVILMVALIIVFSGAVAETAGWA